MQGSAVPSAGLPCVSACLTDLCGARHEAAEGPWLVRQGRHRHRGGRIRRATVGVAHLSGENKQSREMRLRGVGWGGRGPALCLPCEAQVGWAKVLGGGGDKLRCRAVLCCAATDLVWLGGDGSRLVLAQGRHHRDGVTQGAEAAHGRHALQEGRRSQHANTHTYRGSGGSATGALPGVG
jgi:hypothetical protein